MFKLEFTESARDDLRYFNKFEQVIILSAIEKQLVFDPTKETRNKKQLRPNDLSKWQLRVDEYRIFYDADIETVTIKAVGWKEHNKLFIRGREFKL